MDALRGLAIVMVVVWHASAVPALFGVDVPGVVLALNFFFLPFRMPALMVLSGLLLAASLRKPLARYAVGKVQLVVWPYLAWVLVDRLVMGSEHAWFHWRAYYASSYLWFLFFVGVFYAAAPLLRRVPTPVVVAACAAANLVLPPGTEDRLAYFAVFFFLGHLAGQHPGWVDRLTSARWAWPLAVAGAAVGVLSAVTQREHAYQVLLAPFSAAGIVAAVAAARWWAHRGHRMRVLSAVGRHSIVYYASHFPVMVAVVAAAEALGLDDVLLLWALDVAAALLVGALLVSLRPHRPVRWLFEAPRTPSAAVQRWLEARVPASRHPADGSSRRAAAPVPRAPADREGSTPREEPAPR